MGTTLECSICSCTVFFSMIQAEKFNETIYNNILFLYEYMYRQSLLWSLLFPILLLLQVITFS